MARIKSFRETGERYPLLRVLAGLGHAIGFLLVILSTLLLVFGVAAYLSNAMPMNGMGLGVAIVWIFAIFMAGLQSLVLSSFLRLAIHLEENTRATAQALDRLRAGAEDKPEVDALSIFLS